MKKLFVILSVILMLGLAVNVGRSAQYWAKIYEGTANERASLIQQTADGGYVLAGRVYDVILSMTSGY